MQYDRDENVGNHTKTNKQTINMPRLAKYTIDHVILEASLDSKCVKDLYNCVSCASPAVWYVYATTHKQKENYSRNG